MAVWVELHCDQRISKPYPAPVCCSDRGDSPGEMISDFSDMRTAKKWLIAEAKKTGWQKRDNGWWCKQCQQNEIKS